MAKIQSAAKYRQLSAISLSAGANWRSTGRLPLGKAPRQPAHMVRDFADRSYCVIFLASGNLALTATKNLSLNNSKFLALRLYMNTAWYNGIQEGAWH